MDPQQPPQQGSQFVDYSQSPQPSGFVRQPSPYPQKPFVPPQQRRRHGARKFIVGLIIVILVCAFGYAAYAWVLVPDAVLSGIVKNISTSPRLRAKIHIAIQSDVAYLSGTTVDATTMIDRSNPTSPRAKTTIDIASPQFPVMAEFRVIDKVMYGTLTKIPPYFGAISTELTNTWYSVSMDEAQKKYGEYAMISSSTFSSYADVGEIYGKLGASGILGQPHFSGFSIVNGNPARTYSMTIDKTALAQFVAGAEKVQGKTVADAYMQQVSAMSASILDSVDFSPVSFSTDLLTNNIQSIDFSVTMNPAYSTSGQKPMTATVSIVYDDAAGESVEVPPNAVPLEQLIQKSLAEARAKGMDARIQANLAQARAGMELYYSDTSTYLGGCTKNKTVKAVLDDIKNNGHVTPTCRDSARAYLVSAPLTAVSTTTVYACLDSTGVSSLLRVPKIPAGFVCK